MADNSVNISIDLMGMHRWFGGEIRPVLEAVRLADRLGIDEISITDHVVMGEALHTYPYGDFPLPLTEPWFEPLSVLSAIAGVTDRIKLTTNILIAPLRPAALLAKQLATLDCLSRGRVEIGVGTGWQQAEYAASGVPWQDRYARLDEQIRICRALWSQAPASHAGSIAQFDHIHAFPRPYRREVLPIWFGLAPTARNCRRIAELGVGWVPITQCPDEIESGVRRLRQAFLGQGRDPTEIKVRALSRVVFSDAGPDLEASLAAASTLQQAGATSIVFMPTVFCKKPDELEAFLHRLILWKNPGTVADS